MGLEAVSFVLVETSDVEEVFAGSRKKRRNKRRAKGKKTCPRCTASVGVYATICPSCGFNFTISRDL